MTNEPYAEISILLHPPHVFHTHRPAREELTEIYDRIIAIYCPALECKSEL